MNRIYRALTFSSLALLAFALGCGHPRTLQSITIDPAATTVTGTGAGLASFPVKLTAFGHFISPVKTVDVSSEVTWASNTPEIAGVDSTGVVTPTGNGSCGTTLITATAHKGVIGPGESDEIVVGTASFTVNDTSNPNCGAQEPVLTVAVTDAGGLVSGTVNNTATSITGCTQSGGANCVATEPIGTTVVLTATAPATFSSNCSFISSSSCQVVMSGNQNVTVTF
jgi:hypothetical protein